MGFIIDEDFWVTGLRVSGVAVIAGGLPATLLGGGQVFGAGARGAMAAALAFLPAFGPLLCGATLIALAAGYRRWLRREAERRGYPGSINGYLLLWAWAVLSALAVLAALFAGLGPA